MSNHNVISKLNEDIFNKKNVACVTVINTEGSVPRDSGSKMLVYEDGSIYGTVGGGRAEKIAIDEAVKIKR
jgi:xanthine dehydrogenase accessory factor